MDVLLTQMKLMYLQYDCGMWYILRDGDGNFAMLDGGMGEYTEADRAMALLRETSAQPNIKYWFFSHPHDDHFRGFIDFYNKFKGEFTLEHLVFNWPPSCVPCSDLTDFNKTVLQNKLDVITPKTDDVFSMKDVEIKVLGTWEDLPEVNEKTYVNNCSTILSVETKKQRAIFPGDDCGALSAVLCEKYGGDLKADILQLAHHGYWGGSVDFYNAVNPKILLMSAPTYVMPFEKDIAQNKALFESKGLKYIANGNRATETFNLSNPQKITPREKHECFVEDYSAPEMYDRHIQFLTNGLSKFARDGVIEQKQCGCRITSAKNSVVGLMDTEDFPDCKDFEIMLHGEYEAGDVYLIWNCDAPYKWETESFTRLDLPFGCEFFLRLTTDSKKHIATLNINGLEKKLKYKPVKEKGLYLAIQNGGVTVRRTEVRKK